MVHRQGYILVKHEDHPSCDAKGYVMKHRLVMENHLGRYLRGIEVVHHKDGDPGNNAIENLELFDSHVAHMRSHKKDSPAHRIAKDPRLVKMAQDPNLSQRQAAEMFGVHPHTLQNALKISKLEWKSVARKDIDERSAREALQGKSTLEAAQILGVSHQLLRDHFPHLLSKRVSPGFLDARKDEIRNLTKSKTLMEIGEMFGTSGTTIRDNLRRWSKQDGLSDGTEYRRYRGRDKHPRERSGYGAAARERKRALALKA